MPPKIRDLIAELKRAGFEDRAGKGVIGTLCIRKSPNQSQSPGIWAMTPSTIRFGLCV